MTLNERCDSLVIVYRLREGVGYSFRPPSRLDATDACVAACQTAVMKRMGLYVARTQVPGLWVPRSAERRRQSSAGEINPLRASPDPQDLGLAPLTSAQVLRNLSTVPFEPAMVHISALAAEVFHHSDDAEFQLALAEEFYGDPQVVMRLRRFVESESGMLVFDERYITVLQRLLVEHAAPTEGREGLAGAHVSTLLTSLLAIPGIVTSRAPEHQPESGAAEEQLDEWTAFAVQGGAYYEKPDLADAIARAHAIYQDLATEPDLVGHPDVCPLDDWSRADYGVGLAEQIAAGFAAAILAKAVDPDVGLVGRKLALEPGWLGKGPVGQQEPRLTTSFSATREELKTAFAEAGTTAEHVSWDRAPFEQRPFLRLEDGRLSLISPRMIFSWFTSGLYYRLLDSANSRPRPDRVEQTQLMRYTSFVGALSEEYVVRVTREALAGDSPTGSPHVHGDLEYVVGRETKRGPDAAIHEGEDLVLVEVFSGRLPRLARVLADEPRISSALGKIIIEKLEQLSNATADVLAGRVPYPDLDLAAVRRVWPVLVLTGGGIVQLPVLWRFVECQLDADAFADQRVAARTIATLEDYEPLLAIAEEKRVALSHLLAEYHQSPYRELPPRNWVRVAHPRGGPTRPQWVQGRYRAAADVMKRELGMRAEPE